MILSSVRTQKPGFLKSLPRMNVALTRCRKGMVIVTNKGFLQGLGKSTLLGKLCHVWSLNREAWVDWRIMLGTEVELPGIPCAHKQGYSWYHDRMTVASAQC